ncbi:phosphoserine aminotransferase [Phellopilus nigrolimitatus]|nr:phosphoserine aminotransferase [Phellopilus nigrolimitatus]
MDRSQVINFGAGPSALPESVLEEATKALLNFQGTGIGITEISHRSKEFGTVVSQLEQSIRTQLDVPPTHHVLFMQGGGTQQFSSVVLNMQARHRLLHPHLADDERVMDYVVTGSWSKKAVEEARRLGGARVNVVADARAHSSDGKRFVGIPPHETFAFSVDPVLVYYCENETVDGVQYSPQEASPASFPFHLLPRGGAGGGTIPPLVADYSSSFMSRAIPHLADHAIIFAGAQKNIGPSGLTILIVREDCLVDVDSAAKMGATPVPIILAYKTYADSKNLYNTPSTFAVYVAMLVLQRMEKLGGLAAVEETNRRKQEKLYGILAEAEEKGLLHLNVKEGSRSWMNVVFTGRDTEVEKAFLSAGESQGFKAMEGHRSVGGMRISIYNAITEDQVDKVVSFIKQFIAQTVQ